MRITNSMTTNRLLMNINRNATAVERFFMQLSSGKVIQNPSEDPIIASRALRFRTNVTEVQQFQRNVNQAISWMEVSERHLYNMSSSLSRQRSELLVQGASATYTFENRQTIARVIELLKGQVSTELNGTYAGRYVFSGFRTDEPPIITQNNLTSAPGAVPVNNINFEISKTLSRSDIQEEGGALFWRDPAGDLHVVVTPQWLNRPDRDTANWEAGLTNVTTVDSINIVRLPYNRTATRDMNNLAIDTLPPLTIVEVPLNGPLNPYLPPAPGEVTFIPETGELIFNSADLAALEGGVTLSYELDGVYKDEMNPAIFFDTIRTHNGIVTNFTHDAQEIQFELGTNVHLTINTQARDAYRWQLYADLNSFLHWVNNVAITTGVAPGTEQEALERGFFGEMLYTKFTNLMARVDAHIDVHTTEFTTLGARMERMEMIAIRLDENEDTFRALRDQNENIDYIEVIMRLNAAEAVFQAAMQVGARVSQLSLVNFI